MQTCENSFTRVGPSQPQRPANVLAMHNSFHKVGCHVGPAVSTSAAPRLPSVAASPAVKRRGTARCHRCSGDRSRMRIERSRSWPPAGSIARRGQMSDHVMTVRPHTATVRAMPSRRAAKSSISADPRHAPSTRCPSCLSPLRAAVQLITSGSGQTSTATVPGRRRPPAVTCRQRV